MNRSQLNTAEEAIENLANILNITEADMVFLLEDGINSTKKYKEDYEFRNFIDEMKSSFNAY